MTDPAAAMRSLYDNLPSNTGHSLEEWFAILDETGLEKHGELLAELKSTHGLTHGFANAIALAYRSRGTTVESDELVAAQYGGAKAALLPIYERLVVTLTSLGADVEIVPKKTSISVRRSKQFALIEAASAKRVQLGIQLKGMEATERLLAAGGMCSHRVNLASVDDVDAELTDWLREAYERA